MSFRTKSGSASGKKTECPAGRAACHLSRPNLDHEARFLQTLKRAVDCARSHADIAAGRALHLSHDGVAMTGPLSQREKHMKDG
jgi:hypothetical protein